MSGSSPRKPLQRLNPLRGLDHPERVLAWGVFDLANQSFTLIINTLLFGLFVSAVVTGGAEWGGTAWSLMGSASLLAVVVVSPVLGALADARAAKKKFLLATGFACAGLTCALALIPSGASVGVWTAVAIAAALYVPANIAFNVGENFLASFLPEIATRETVGRVSATGWTMGYVGALLLLGAMAALTRILGVDVEASYRPLFVFAGLWFAVMMLPTALFLPEAARPVQRAAGVDARAHPLRAAVARLRRDLAEARTFRDLAALLAAFFVYGMGVQVIVFFGGLIAKEDFGFEITQMFLFVATITVAAAASAAGVAFVQDRIGHKRMILGMLTVWALTAATLGTLTFLGARRPEGDPLPVWPVWAAGIALGVGLGGVGTATRAAVSSLTPAHRAAEFFGLWGATYKLAGVVGLPAFGVVRWAIGPTASFVVLGAFFVVGGAMLGRVRFARGHAAADASENEHAREIEADDIAALGGRWAPSSGPTSREGPPR